MNINMGIFSCTRVDGLVATIERLAVNHMMEWQDMV